MAKDSDHFMACLIPRCFRRKKTPPVARNVFEQRMKQRLRKQSRRAPEAKHTRLPPVDEELATLDLLDARKRAVATKERRPPWLSWDSLDDTFVSPPSSVGAEAGGVVGTTHTNTPPDYDPEASSGYTAQLTRQQVTHEAAFRLQQLARLDMNNATPSFAYQVPRPSARKWSMATTDGSVNASGSVV